jgi:hypothetical protein
MRLIGLAVVLAVSLALVARGEGQGSGGREKASAVPS